jgi:hypothetical protein
MMVNNGGLSAELRFDLTSRQQGTRPKAAPYIIKGRHLFFAFCFSIGAGRANEKAT